VAARVALVLLAVTVILLGVGCGGWDGEDEHGVDEAHPEAVALAFVDVSKSTYGPEGARRALYAKDFDRIVASMPPGTLLKVDLIDSNPLSSSSLPISEFFKKYQGMTHKDNEREVRQHNEGAAERASAAFRKLIMRRPTGNSILDSLDVAQNVFDSFPTAKARYLVIFSDMIENSDRYRFTNENLTADRVQTFIAAEDEAGRLPDLSGVQIYVAGAGATRGADAAPARTRLIKQFWLMYIAATKADLPPARYGPTLIRFP
jgi:hypothetical protein